MSIRYVLFAVATAGALALDQLTKWLIVQHVGARDELDVIPGFLSIVHAKNPGAAFSFMDESAYRMYVFGAFTLIAIAVLLHTLRQLGDDERMQAVAAGLLMGGTLGNGLDRLLHQEVTDFIRVYTDWPPIAERLIGWFGTNTWPIFNVADSAIVAGVGLFLLHFLLVERGGAGGDVGLA